jgi:hypothetical protein
MRETVARKMVSDGLAPVTGGGRLRHQNGQRTALAG